MTEKAKPVIGRISALLLILIVALPVPGFPLDPTNWDDDGSPQLVINSKDGKSRAYLRLGLSTMDEWHRTICISFVSHIDQVWKSYKFGEICPPSRWRNHDKDTLTKWYSEVTLEGDFLTVKTADGHTVVFSMLTGAVLPSDSFRPVGFLWIVGLGLVVLAALVWLRKRLARIQSHREA